MQTYDDFVELALQCAKQARLTTSRDVAQEFWCMAKEYQEKAAKHDGGKLPDLGPLPPWMIQE
jgi:hypothetical protein